MSFTSIKFLPFLAIAAAFYYLLPRRCRWLSLLGISLVFYLLLDVWGVFLVFAAVLVSWACALRMEHIPAANGARRFWLALGIAVDIGLLIALKYGGALAQSLNIQSLADRLLVPLGISYYSLQLVSYLMDVYRGQLPAEKNPLRVAGYALFFLSIVQGPFHCYKNFYLQIDDGPAFDRQRVWNGARRMAWGYFQKLAVAERASLMVSTTFENPQAFSGIQLIAGVLAFSVQLYADFAGYTNIALGAGEILGLQLPENFRQPYLACSIQDFWKRWHISLSTWFRDYLYIPLGGNRRGLARTYLNLLITFAVSGLWHGTAGHYMIWGMLNGLFQIIGRQTAALRDACCRAVGLQRHPRLQRAWQTLCTFVLVNIAWVFFRADSVEKACVYLGQIVTGFASRGFGAGQLFELGLNRMGVLYLLMGILWIVAVDLLHERGLPLRKKLDAAPIWLRWPVYWAWIWCMAFMGIFMAGGSATFLYARF